MCAILCHRGLHINVNNNNNEEEEEEKENGEMRVCSATVKICVTALNRRQYNTITVGTRAKSLIKVSLILNNT